MVRLLMLSGLILLLAAPTASAGTREQILRECQEGRITGNYTPGQLRDARKHIPTDIDEYSDCRDVLSRAALGGNDTGDGSGGGAAGGGGGGRGGIDTGAKPEGANRPANDRETQALGDARTSADELIVDGDRFVPGVAAKEVRRGLPTPLLVVLALLGLCALAAFLPTARRRVHLRRATP
jgi:hypothetical protein